MTDTITESFCERCGTRYSFEPTAKPRRGGVGRVRVLGRGFKNYIANDGLPMSEAMAAARDEEDRAGTARQLDAFHKTFNFCMSCRQYTCGNCWNEKAGECLTCAPDLTREVLPAPFPDLPAEGPAAAGNGHAETAAAAEALAWPSVDLDRARPGAASAGSPDAAPDTAPGAPEHAAAAPGDAAAAPDRLAEPTAEPLSVADEVTAYEPASEEPGVLARLDAFVATPGEAAVEELTPEELAEIENALAAAQPAEAMPTAPIDAISGAPVSATGEIAAGAAEPEPADAELQLAAAEPEPAAAELQPSVVDAERATAPAGAEMPGLQPAAGEPEPAASEGPAIAPVAAAAAPESTGALPEGAQALPEEPADRIEAARGQTKSLLGRFRPARRAGAMPGATQAARPEGQPAPATQPAPTAAVSPTPTPLESAPSAADQPAAAVPAQPAPVATPAPAPTDVIPQPTWQVVAPDTAPTEAPHWPEAPAWPAASATSAPGPDAVPGPAAAPWASRLATARPEPTGIWAASSQEVLGVPPGPGAGPSQATGAPAIQACISCGLSLSANARFCRRCGTRQG